MQSSSVDLTFHNLWVDNGSGIVDAEPVQNVHLPGIRVDFDHGDLDHKAIGVGGIDSVLRVGSHVGGEAEDRSGLKACFDVIGEKFMIPVGGSGNPLDGYVLLGIVLGKNLSLLDDQILLGNRQECGSQVNDLPFELTGRQDRCAGPHRSKAAGVGS